MDCEMPTLNGLDATREIRAFEQERHRASTPIVALSAHAVQSQVEACYAAGMNAYLSKPVDVEKLEALLAACAVHSVEELCLGDDGIERNAAAQARVG